MNADGSLVAAVTGSNFAARRLHLIDAARGAIAQTIAIGDSFVGVAFSPDGRTIYVGGNADNDVKIFRRDDAGTFRADGAVSIPGSAPSGLSLSPDGATLYAALNLRHSLGIIDTVTRAVREIPVGRLPYTALASPDGRKVWISNWGGRRAQAGDASEGGVVIDPRTGIVSSGAVSVLDVATGAIGAEIAVGLHPSAMALSPDGRRLYVANANSDTVSVIDTASDRVEKTIEVRLFAGAPLGSAPNALAVSPDGRTLFVANAANNAVAVVDPDAVFGSLRGFIPTGWFPTAVALSADGRRLFVASGYGFGSIAPTPAGRRGRSYSDRAGVVSILDVPDESRLTAYTAQVMRNNRAPSAVASLGGVRAASARPRPIPMHLGEPSPIHYVFYIIKENRTYDQVFGDLPQGNGDASLVQFGRDVTPNQHALAERYVLLNNFYTVGDQSALGHQWANEAYANDYVHKYGNFRNDFAGTNPMAYAPSGFLWDNVRRHGKRARVYGEFGLNTLAPGSATWTDIYNDWRNGTANVRITPRTQVAGLHEIFAPRFPGYDMRITDQVRVEEFLREFRSFLPPPPRARGRAGPAAPPPELTVMLFPVNHTNGTSPGFPTPRAMVADNDLALGRIVEAISHSPFWPHSAILVTEDDAQNGLDHVDGHRTVGLVISPYARRGAVDSTLYTTISMVRTIEQILGLAPMNQFDLAAEPMFSAFTDEPDFTPYIALPNRIPLDEMNPALAATQGLARRLAEASLRMDFSQPDAAPEDLLNRVIWHSVKGYQRPYPARRAGGMPRPLLRLQHLLDSEF